MADFLTENSMLLSSSFASSSFYFSNLTGGSDFDSVMKTSTDEKLNMNELAGASTNNADAYTRIVSATVMSSQMMAQTGADGRVSYSYQGVMQKFEIRIDVNGEDRTYTAVGTDKDGNPFSKEIDPYNVDPTDADFTEFAALCSYIYETENIADKAMNFVSEIADTDIFKQMDYLSAFSANISKYEMMGFSNLTAESLMPHINRLMEVLMNSGMSGSVGSVSTLDFEYNKLGVTEKVDEAEPVEDERTIDLGMGFLLTPGSGVGMTARQIINPDSEDLIVRVQLSGGKEYDVNLNEVDPRNATAIEMFAYCQYADSIGASVANTHFGSWSALKSMMDPLGGMECKSIDEAVSKKLDWTKNVSESDYKFVNQTTGEALTAEDVIKMLMETYQKIDHSDVEDWRKISDEEWEKLLAKPTNKKSRDN
ncbi:hypothetical protein [Pseudobutyrivibrio sp.]